VSAVDDERAGVRVAVVLVVVCGFGAEAFGVLVVREATQRAGHGAVRAQWQPQFPVGSG
jgi:hypothetical protein